MKRTWTGWAANLAAPAAFVLLVALLYAVVAACALHAAKAPWEAPFDAMAVELAEYLTGKSAALSPMLFTEREILHMVDVLALFKGALVLAVVCALGGVALLIAAATARHWRRMGTCMLIGMGVFAGIVACMGAWAAIDFEGWFVRMHELVFTNDLWLLDPAESMLIQMVPLSFFIDMVCKVALWFGLGALCFAAAALCLRRIGKRPCMP